MAREVVCPHCGLSLPIEPLDEPLPSLDTARTVEMVLPGTVSTEEGGSRARVPGGLAPDVIAGSLPNGRSFLESGPPPDPDHLEFPPVGSPDPDREPQAAPQESGSQLAFPAIQLDAPAVPAAGSGSVEELLHDEPRTPWAMVLLGSYASAMTLACLWLWWNGRRPEPSLPDTIPADSRPDLETAIPAAAPAPVALPEDRITTLGVPLRIGAVEFTPLEVRVGQVELEHVGIEGQPEWRDGGPGALFLRVRLTNRSPDATFAPLEPAFVREPDRGRPESFLESPSGERIDTFPLPQASEWSIHGQTFRELRPGESFETVLVSAPESAARFAPEMTWRVRLRTGPEPGRTEFVGVCIRQGEVQ
jgi:hypothetical protein